MSVIKKRVLDDGADVMVMMLVMMTTATMKRMILTKIFDRLLHLLQVNKIPACKCRFSQIFKEKRPFVNKIIMMGLKDMSFENLFQNNVPFCNYISRKGKSLKKMRVLFRPR